MQKILITTSLLLFLQAQGCVQDAEPRQTDSQTIEGSNRLTESNSAGNLIASAVKEYYDVDVALIPSVILKDGQSFRLESSGEVTSETRSQLFSLYDETKDTVRTGTMRGSDIKDFILRRLTRTMDIDLQVAGVRYDLQMRGGWPDTYVVTRDKGLELEDDRRYRVAVSNFFYDFKSMFPGYYYGDNMSFSLAVETDGFGSIKTALDDFLQKEPNVAPLQEPRAFVSNRIAGELDSLKISEIQGTSHLSRYRGYKVSTRGIITGVGVPKESDAKTWRNFPGRELPTEIIIQDPEGDGDDRTSEGLSIFLPGNVTNYKEIYKPGQLIEARGVVHEAHTGGGFSGTSLRQIESIRVLAENQALPIPIVIGSGGRTIHMKRPSTFPGDLNARAELNINEGIDFWESLEGMRIQLVKPRVTGTRGGLKDYNAVKQGRASYVEISLMASGMDTPEERTSMGGNFYDPYAQDFNVETVKMIDSPFSDAINPSKLIIDNGDTFNKDLIGVLSFNQNNFGDGRYAFYLTGNLEKFEKGVSDPTEIKTGFDATDDHLTFATWNVENLGGTDTDRLKDTAGVISNSIKCPDIMTMPEIQDNNAERITGGSAADQTLANIIKNLNCPGSNYKALNIDPIPFHDGGEYGGNIRVAMIYNASRVSFTPKGNPTATSRTYVEADGSLSQNPGRIDPLNLALEGSRKSLVAEFNFRGKKIFVIGNHFNSMLGEGSPMGAMQPYRFQTETKRTEIAGIVRNFVETLRNRNSDVRLIIAGDFNCYFRSNSMATLAGTFMTNLMTAPGVNYPKDRWFSTDYDGNSGAIDFIFASPTLMQQEPEFRILHINSPFMVKTSDHDPVVSRYKF